MCNYVSTPDKKALRQYLEEGIKIEDYMPHYLSSGFKHEEEPVMLMEESDKVQPVVWGYIPEMFTPEKAMEYHKSAYSLNAKVETMFKLSIYSRAAKSRRCLVFVDGFYEWRHDQIGSKIEKIPHYIQMPDHKPFALGGLYSRWSHKSDDPALTTHNVLTTPANTLMASIHNTKKRMPLILDEKDWGIWLDPLASEQQVMSIAKQYPEGFLDAHVVALSLKKGVDNDRAEVQRREDF